MFAPIHLSFLDPPLIAVGGRRALNFMAKEELFRGALKWLIVSLNSFPVRRGENDTEAIKEGIRRLQAGQAVLIFPEGTRGDGKTLGVISPGIAMFAKKTDAAVVPVGLVGSHLAWPKGQKKLRRHHMTVVFGTPFRYSEVATGASEKENREIFARELAQRIALACHEGGLPVEIAEENRPKGP